MANIKNIDKFIYNFYTTPRLSFQGNRHFSGPFNFDIHKAYDACTIIENGNVNTIIETGTNTGDTTEFLAKQYPEKKIITCDVVPNFCQIAKMRLKKYKNVNVFEVSSEFIIKDVCQKKQNIFYYLDAHLQEDYWPLRNELSLIKRGYVMVDDFRIGSLNYRYDINGGIRCDYNFVKLYSQVSEIYINNILFDYPVINNQIQEGIKSGRCFYQKQFDSSLFLKENFRKI